MDINQTSKKIIDSIIIPNYEYMGSLSISELIIKEGTHEIGTRSFSFCPNLRKVTLPDSLTNIGDGAFSKCENLEEVYIPKNVKKIEARAFADCKRLKRVIIPEGVEELEWAVFSGCENLEEVILPDSIKKIDEQLFLNCKKLKKVKLPKNLSYLPNQCFKGCNNLDISLNDNIKELGDRVFEDCHKLSTYPTHIIKAGENCFRNCRNIETVNLNDDIEYISDGMFDGCVNLKEINCNKKELSIGKKSFRNCTRITSIPPFVTKYNEQAFENCNGLTEITIASPMIPQACFRGCKNLKTILNQDIIQSIQSYCFSGCENLEEISLQNITFVPAEAFSHCKKLVKIILNEGINKIGSRAFYKCSNLSEINLPDSIEVIKKEAFRYCHNIKSITIPASLKTLGIAAFACMDSLENINVSTYNKEFITPDHKILINIKYQQLILYASGCKDKSYSLKNYNVEYDILNRELIKPITYIKEFAFTGAKNLEELTICACTQDIESTAFYDCKNLKKLNIEAIPLFSAPGFKVQENGRYYFPEKAKNKIFFPFETVEFKGDISIIFQNALQYFENVREIILPKNKSYNIGTRAFRDCHKLKTINIPKSINSISEDAFPYTTEVIFENGLKITGLVKLSHDDKYIGDYKLYELTDGTFYIEQEDTITKLTKEQIDKLCSHSEEIRDNPILFLDFMNDLARNDLDIKLLYNGILMSNISLENRKILFDNIKKDDTFALNVLKHSGILDVKDPDTKYLLEKNNFSEVIDFINLLRKYNITDSQLYNKLFICCCKTENFEKIITYNYPLLIKILKQSKLFNVNMTNTDNSPEGISGWELTRYILLENTIAKFIKYVEKYDIKDRYLIDKPFISICDNPLSEQFFKAYDANIKRLLKNSKLTDNYLSIRQNLNDLLNLLKITGALEEDPITRQRASTFISDNIFIDKLPNGDLNEYKIVGDDIHRIFNFQYLREEFDKEFANFFLENYKELVDQERKTAGFIERVYHNFREISKTSTSDKGQQRHLKITMNKCINFLSNVKFDGVNDENQDFANLISAWYDDNKNWITAQRIYHESLSAPRNIFTKVTTDEFGNIIYDNNPNNDLKEENNENFSYHWLPKQEYDNLILGKYCNCCAHVTGAGQGIMRASMISDCCQNLVIRNNVGEIISKSTIYVNKEKGYAVFNNVESSINYRDDESLKKIYKAFMRGASTFINAYNKNNEIKINTISIGANRNTILRFLDEENHPFVNIQEAIHYSRYSLLPSGYDGDWKSVQKLVLKR